jgi:alpha-glucuronidase
VATVVSGKKAPYKPGAIVGVSNMGDDPNWFGHLLAGANLFAFGKLAWDSATPTDSIIADWSRLTFVSDSPKALNVVSRILHKSYDLYARYTVPLGINYMFERNHHFEPRVSSLSKEAWNNEAAGMDRSITSGTQFLAQYAPEARHHWEKPESTCVHQLLFFHRLPWHYQMPDGRTLGEYIRDDRIAAVDELRHWLKQWRSLRNELDPQTWAHVYERLQRQYVHAGKWRDAGLEALRRVGQLSEEAILQEEESIHGIEQPC